MAEERYTLDIPMGYIPALYVSISGLTKEQVIDITRSQIENGVYPDRELLEFIIENSEFNKKGET